jgi:sulfotransferase
MQPTLFAISGMPRTGSTLLATMLSQNSDIYTEGNSGLCQLTWDVYKTCKGECDEYLSANRKSEITIDSILSALPSLYYKGVSNKYIFDRGKTWPSHANMNLMRRYLNKTPKIIVLVRPVIEVVESLVNLQIKNGLEGELYNNLSHPQSTSINMPFNATLSALKSKSDDFLFIQYADLVYSPEKTISKIYEFCGISEFKHTFSKIKQTWKEDDSVYRLEGMHSVREKIQVNKYEVEISKIIKMQCADMDKELNETLLTYQNISLASTK